MKFLKSRTATALTLAGLTFSLLAFSTTSVEAQDTSSTPAESEEFFVISNTEMLRQALGYWEQSLHRIGIGGVFQIETETLPEDTLDTP